MKIEDLDCLETIDKTIQVIGASGAYTSAYTYTDAGFAYAQGSAVAIGVNTSTNSQTFTKVKSSPINNFSQATVKTTATAQTSYGSYSSVSTSRSLYIS